MSTIAGLVTEMMKKSRDYYGDLGVPYDEQGYVDYFNTFTDMPQKADFQGLVDQCSAGRAKLSYGDAGTDLTDPVSGGAVPANSTLLDINAVADQLDDWRGNAAVSFRDNVKTPFPAKVQNQFLAASFIYGAATAEQATWDHANENVKTILQNAINAIDSLDDCNPDEFTSFITVAAAIATIVVTEGAAAIAVSGVAALGTVLDQGDSFGTGGGEPMYILASTKKACDEVIKQVSDNEGKVSKALTGVTHWMNASPGDFDLAHQPSLADHAGGLTSMK